MNLLDLLTGNTANQVAQETESKLGISKSQILALLAVATPLVISYLKNKSQDVKEAEALSQALDRDHDGSILSNPSQLATRETEGNSILSHIFGNEKTNVENQLSQKTGISMDKIGPALAMLAPLVMGFIGKEKQQNNVTAGGMGDLLGNMLNTNNTKGADIGSIARDFLDKDGDGSMLDDLFNIFTKKK
ncbi:DUF937 domain-containing protein [Elizabethkingia sp. JS20170427COW]|uniref:DUF937 domain-containing protein n=1 Tax=Elizabethkingia sp. JS20170427COW TaxID=2583851 RepID=UPI001110C519|nr:DUF937 domain-containing protein [Elizabethkingia sp. JS20170427COW]QCX53748.1 DUF937 domain-containing protein [Elizabethkingia sp. JS20170427COW]